MERKLDRLVKGEDIGLIRLRKGDELKEIAEKINELILVVEKSRASAKKSDSRNNA